MVTPDSEEVDEVFEALDHQFRRESIRYLERRQEEQTSISELVNHIEQRESTTNTERIELQLHHSHLPKLEAMGWLEYDSEQGRITYHGHEKAAQILSDMTERLDT